MTKIGHFKIKTLCYESCQNENFVCKKLLSRVHRTMYCKPFSYMLRKEGCRAISVRHVLNSQKFFLISIFHHGMPRHLSQRQLAQRQLAQQQLAQWHLCHFHLSQYNSCLNMTNVSIPFVPIRQMSQFHLSQYDSCLKSICPNRTNVSIPFVPIQQMSQIPLIQFRPAGKFGLKIHLGSIRKQPNLPRRPAVTWKKRLQVLGFLASGRGPYLSFFYGNPTNVVFLG